MNSNIFYKKKPCKLVSLSIMKNGLGIEKEKRDKVSYTEKALNK